MNQMNKIIVVGGGKGGVGKTTISMAVVDTLLKHDKEVILIESDKENSDAFFALENVIPCVVCDLSQIEGWELLGNTLESNPTKWIVINTAAGATGQLVEFGHLLADAAKELGIGMVMLWPINRQRDCLELLRKFFEGDSASAYQATYVVKNTYFGEAKKFARFDNSKIKERTTGTISMPELYDTLTDKIVDNRWAFGSTTGLSIVERSILNKFRSDVDQAFKVLL